MTVTFPLTSTDLLAYNRYAAKHLPSARRMRYFMTFLFVANSLAMTLTSEDKELSFRIVYFCLVFLLTYGIWRLFTFLLASITLARAFTPEKQKSTLCEHTITLADDALIEVTPFNEARHRWAGVYQVKQNADYIYIFIAPNAAHVIPKRAFPDAQGAQAFHERALQLHAASRHDAAAT